MWLLNRTIFLTLEQLLSATSSLEQSWLIHRGDSRIEPGKWPRNIGG